MYDERGICTFSTIFCQFSQYTLFELCTHMFLYKSNSFVQKIKNDVVITARGLLFELNVSE